MMLCVTFDFGRFNWLMSPKPRMILVGTSLTRSLAQLSIETQCFLAKSSSSLLLVSPSIDELFD